MNNRNQLFLLIIGMIMSLLALVAMQWYWLREVALTRQTQFDQAVAEALRQTNYRLEGMEASRLLRQALDSKKWVKQFDSLAGSPLLYRFDTIQEPARQMPPAVASPPSIIVFSDSFPKPATAITRSAAGIRAHPDMAMLQKADSLLRTAMRTNPSAMTYSFRMEQKTDSILRVIGATDSLILKQLEKKPLQRVIIHSDVQGTFSSVLPPSPSKSAGKLRKNNDKSTIERTIVQRTVPIDSLLAQVARDFIAPKQPIEKRINQSQFDSILASNLRQSGIKLPYTYWVSRDENGENKLIFGNNQLPPQGTHLYQTRLFPNDVFHQNEQLMLYFLEESSFLGQGMGAMYFLAAMLLLLVGGIFYAAFRYLMHHKKLSEVKSDFINNMSHELKTPLATINLATDALANEKVKSEPAAIDKYLQIIKSENRRMNQHVELILQTARLERKDLKLRFSDVPLNDLLEHAIDLMQMQFEEKGGQIVREGELDVQVMADETHLLNVFTNLLDNAMKYCNGQPLVRVTVGRKGQMLSISFSDNGMGMSKEQIEHIFDPFYRVPSGNIHNVKGFGLGLSYAKAIVVGHGGQLEVKSQPGEGSTFIIHLPLHSNPHG